MRPLVERIPNMTQNPCTPWEVEAVGRERRQLPAGSNPFFISCCQFPACKAQILPDMESVRRMLVLADS